MYTIYYTKNDNPHRREWMGWSDETIPYSIDTIAATHVAVMSNVCTGNANANVTEDLEHIYKDFQADFMPTSRVADWCQWCRNQNASHSSMSIGDIVVDQRTGQGWIVAGAGFMPVPPTKG